MAGDPADVRRAEVNIVLMEIEDVLRCEVGSDGVSTGGVDVALGFAGGSAGVQDVERVFRIHPFGGAIGRSLRCEFMPPVIAPGLHVHGLSGALIDNDV